jgi:CheY-like chemotaxis protein
MLKMLQRLIGEDIHLKLQADPNLWPVKIDPTQIDQIMANLCVNARDAIDDEGIICIEIGNRTFDAGCCTNELPGEYVQLQVSDNGCGMDSETLNHIFEPFFTTKGLGFGTGLGLATVFGIVKQNNGFINVYSQPGIGTTFKLYFPKTNLEMGTVSTDDLEPTIKLGSGTVLLVEDEALLRKMVTGMLTQLGYHVLDVKNPMEAISLCESDTFKKIDLILTDIVMPDMNGKEMCDRILALRPGIPVLFMSGFTADIIESKGILEDSVNFIHKPFNIRKLSQMIFKIFS